MRKFLITQYPDLPGLFQIDEPENPKFKELFEHNGFTEMNVFSSYNDGIKWLNRRFSCKKKITIELIIDNTGDDDNHINGIYLQELRNQMFV